MQVKSAQYPNEDDIMHRRVNNKHYAAPFNFMHFCDNLVTVSAFAFHLYEK